MTRQERVTVALLSDAQGRMEVVVQADAVREGAGLIDTVRSGAPGIHLLQGDDVGPAGIDDGGDAVEGDATVHAAAMADVVADKAESGTGRADLRGHAARSAGQAQCRSRVILGSGRPGGSPTIGTRRYRIASPASSGGSAEIEALKR